ncbi:hypothetical protein F0562_020100 [Nyssa sinensis]|uniref:MADS-box domain-containing protein n=1 Tax=Nyssa sinensis TaxID=561372 RepID=A0A5J5BRR3_9ASTE|nr:hypothetical protein F0562_020100 [Nyssa sinensis]
MTRKKVKLAFITNDSARKATFKKRKKGLMKKVSELSTLCGIDACAIIYSPYETQPEVWPSTMGVQRVLAQFKRMPEMEQSKKMVNQESFIRQRIAKANEQLKKQHKDNREKEMTEVMYQCLTGRGMQNLVMADLNDLGWLLDQNLKEIYKRIESLKKMAPPQVVAPPPPVVAAATSEMVVRGGVHGQEHKPAVDLSMDVMQMQRPQWFTEWMMMNNPNDQHMGFGGDDQMMMPFMDNHNAMWWCIGGLFHWSFLLVLKSACVAPSAQTIQDC